MNHYDCEFESDVVAAVTQSRWPDRVDSQLREHAAQCFVCRDVVVAATAIEELQMEPGPEALPSANRVWWLAQLRVRREAARTAAKPITVTQLLAVSCAIGLLGACFGATSGWFQSALRRVSAWLSDPRLRAFLAHHVLAAITLAAVLILLPASVLVWLRSEGETRASDNPSR